MLDAILGSKPFTKPLIVVDTLADNKDESISYDENGDEGQPIHVEHKGRVLRMLMM